MMKKKKQLPILEKVTITDIGAEGKAIAKVNNCVVFVPYVVPGDVVDLQVTQKKKSYMEARAVKFHQYSEKRCQPICQHFGVCGGCSWQMLPYSEQLFYKQKQVEDHLLHIGKIQFPPLLPILSSDKTEFYRNKLEFAFSNKRWKTSEEMQQQEKTSKNENAVGFHIPGKFDKVLDIEKCWLQDDISNQIRNEVRRYAMEKGFSFFDLRRQEGFLRTMIIRTSSTGEVMVIISFFQENKKWREDLLQYLADTFPQITSLLYVINPKANDTIADQKINVFKGNEYIFEVMEDLKFKIGPKSFFQTNTAQACKLYQVVKNFAQLTGKELVYDLYSGTGTIANFMARHCKKVIGIEYVPEAVIDAIANSDLNQIKNTSFFAGDMKKIMTPEFIQQQGQPDVIITDPPRVGMHADVIKAILQTHTQRIVYVSCNSATQARDLNLMDAQYHIVAIQPVDMFPHTHHVENVVLLEHR
ncbi:MAG TPA: 23S rRNA (uracil(1939)-C(5))-methyltransferase RlmD [Paludibacteraceae bacterium]|nr:23S rRNA (uracil(1939)-C(5))-methyltransferase RlmD [Paludibacteraceae bacterium]